MRRRQFLLCAPAALVAHAAPAQSGSGVVVVVGHAALPRIDVTLVQRLYTGRAIEVGSQLATMVNLRSGHPLRQRFLATFLQTDEERYRAYWTVRRHVGKGAPPRELNDVSEVLDFVARTPGALGYIDATDLQARSNVICRV